jgi:hypothetical protein
LGTDVDVVVAAAARKLYRTILAATFPSRNERDEDAIVGVDLEVTRVQSASVRLTVTTTPNLRTVARSSIGQRIRGVALGSFSKQQGCPVEAVQQRFGRQLQVRFRR